MGGGGGGGYTRDEHRNAIALSAHGEMEKRSIKEFSQFDNKGQRSLSRSLTILISIIRIQVRLSKAVTSRI